MAVKKFILTVEHNNFDEIFKDKNWLEWKSNIVSIPYIYTKADIMIKEINEFNVSEEKKEPKKIQDINKLAVLREIQRMFLDNVDKEWLETNQNFIREGFEIVEEFISTEEMLQIDKDFKEIEKNCVKLEEEMKFYCEICSKECNITYWDKEKTRVKCVSCPDCGGCHAHGNYQNYCGSKWCRCGQ